MCVSLFSYQGSLLFSSDNFDSLSCSKPFVKNFFHLFFAFRKLLFALSNDSFYTLSYQLSSVKNFFNFFRNRLAFKKRFALLRQLDYNITLIRACQPNFLLFFNFLLLTLSFFLFLWWLFFLSVSGDFVIRFFHILHHVAFCVFLAL